MSATTTELADVLRALAQLRTGVGALRARYGDVPTVNRVANDLQRLEIDIAELPNDAPTPTQRGSSQGTRSRDDVVEVPDTPYDPALWRDVDDEGVGGQPPQNY